MAAMGASEADIERCKKQWKADLPEYEFVEVMPENVEAFEAFLSLQDQWHYPGNGANRLCLPHADVWACVQGLGITNPQDTFKRVLKISAAARPLLIEKFEAKAK